MTFILQVQKKHFLYIIMYFFIFSYYLQIGFDKYQVFKVIYLSDSNLKVDCKIHLGRFFCPLI